MDTSLKSWELLPVSFALGTGFLTLFLFYFSLCGLLLPKGKWPLVFSWLLIIIICALKRKRIFVFTKEIIHSLIQPLNLLALALLGMIWLAAFIVEPLFVPLHDWDVLIGFAYKAKILFSESAAKTDFFQVLSFGNAHLDYPLYLPFLYIWIYSFIGKVHEHWAVIFSPILFFLLLVYFFNAIKEISGPEKGSRLFSLQPLLFTLILACLPFFYDKNLIPMQRPDFFISFFYLLAVAHGWKWILRKKKLDLYLASSFGVLLGWIKLEGMMLGMVLFFLIALMGGRGGIKKVLISHGVAFLFVSPWYLYRMAIPKVYEDYGGRLLEISFFDILPRIMESIHHSHVIFTYESWLIFWPTLIACLVIGFRFFFLTRAVFLVLVLLVPASAFIFIFSINPLWSPSGLINMAGKRLFFELAPSALYVTALGYNRFFWQETGSGLIFFKNIRAASIAGGLFLMIWAGLSVVSFQPTGKKAWFRLKSQKTFGPMDLEAKKAYWWGHYCSAWKKVKEFHGENPSSIFATSNSKNMKGSWSLFFGNYVLYPARVYISDPDKVFLDDYLTPFTGEPTDKWLISKNIFTRVHFTEKNGLLFIDYRNLKSPDVVGK